MISKNSIVRIFETKDGVSHNTNNINIVDISDPGLRDLFLSNFTEEEIKNNKVFMDILYKNLCIIKDKERANLYNI